MTLFSSWLMNWRRASLVSMVVNGLATFACLLGLLLSNRVVLADGPLVLGYERIHAAQPPTEAAGRLLLSELSCASCHRHEAREAISPKLGPNLDGVGERIQRDYLEAYLANPSQLRPHSTMPDVMNGLPEEARAQKAAALAAFLSGSQRPRLAPPNTGAVERGDKLFHSVGCTVCHADLKAEAATGISLDHVAAKTGIPALAEFLRDPLRHRPSGRMPRLGLNEAEANEIANYLLQGVDVPAALKFAYYEGNWDKLPDFEQLEPKSTGTASSLDVVVGRRKDNFGVVFTTYLMVPQQGTYTFHIGSDDGSRLTIDGEVVATVDGIHPVQFASGNKDLTAGPHEVRVEFFEGSGGEELRVEWEGAGLNRGSIEGWLSADGKPVASSEPVTASADLVAQGKREFVSLGCASCHQRSDLAPAEPRALVSIERVAGGCLAAAQSAPAFGLTDHQRESISLALANAADASEPQAESELRIAETMVKFNCVACHQRGELGGVLPEADPIFTSTQPEMGDEGRLPPPLNGVGSKLRPEWFEQLLDQGAHDRFYMQVRMPGFGKQNVGHLVHDLASLDTLPEKVEVHSDEPLRRLRAAGRQLVGDQGQSCIKCHVFGNQPATGIQAISLTTMTKRLNQDWFMVYMLDPNALRPGTRMPQSWPGGATFFPNLLDGQGTTQIYAVWEYLAEGEQASLPNGLGTVAAELVAESEPVMYRNFIEGAGARAIGVGYPERVNLAFDAEQLRLALTWQARFIDAGLHWTGRGVGYQKPLGDNVLNHPNGPGVIATAGLEGAWPGGNVRDHGGRFRGYRFDEQRRPIFLYDVDARRVEDGFVPIEDPLFPGLRRIIEVAAGAESSDKSIVFRLVNAGELKALDDGSFQTSDGLRIIPSPETELTPRTVDGRAELLWIVPSNAAGRAELEYRW